MGEHTGQNQPPNPGKNHVGMQEKSPWLGEGMASPTWLV
jgi:hypothetical protein